LLHPLTIHRLDLEQFECQCTHRWTLTFDDLTCGLVAAHDERADLIVNAACGFFAEAGGA